MARPDGSGKDAERTLLDRFHDLQTTYLGQKSGRTLSLILIYSWLMPCNMCTDDIIEFKSTVWYKVIVIYRSDYPGCSEEENKENRRKLCNANVDVFHVSYNIDLTR